MHVSLFKLAPTGSRKGITCDADGAFIGTIPLLKRVRENGRDVWVPRDHRSVSKELGACFGLPIDLASKAAGLAAIARALNAGDVARAQMLTLFLRFPDPAPILKAKPARAEVLKFVGQLIEGDFIKANSNRTELAKFNPNHWPAKSPEGPGRFAPKGEGAVGTPLSGEPEKTELHLPSHSSAENPTEDVRVTAGQTDSASFGTDSFGNPIGRTSECRWTLSHHFPKPATKSLLTLSSSACPAALLRILRRPPTTQPSFTKALSRHYSYLTLVTI